MTVSNALRMFALAGAGALAWLSTLAAAADYPAMTIKFGDVVNRNFGYYQGMVAFKNEIEKRTDGKIKVDILTDGKLGSPKDTRADGNEYRRLHAEHRRRTWHLEHALCIPQPKNLA